MTKALDFCFFNLEKIIIIIKNEREKAFLKQVKMYALDVKPGANASHQRTILFYFFFPAHVSFFLSDAPYELCKCLNVWLFQTGYIYKYISVCYHCCAIMYSKKHVMQLTGFLRFWTLLLLKLHSPPFLVLFKSKNW